jgi:uncharacterized protein YggU (UPF0235/DUF167 family)
MANAAIESRDPDGSTPLVHVHLKVVPGASREGLAGRYGDRLKLRVTAAPESGKANKAVLALLARMLGLPKANLELVRGTAMPLKTVAVRGLAVAEVERLLV